MNIKRCSPSLRIIDNSLNKFSAFDCTILVAWRQSHQQLINFLLRKWLIFITSLKWNYCYFSTRQSNHEALDAKEQKRIRSWNSYFMTRVYLPRSRPSALSQYISKNLNHMLTKRRLQWNPFQCAEAAAVGCPAGKISNCLELALSASKSKSAVHHSFSL